MEASAETKVESENVIHAKNLVEAFHDTVEKTPDQVAVRTRDDSTSLTFTELKERVDAFAGGLSSLGVKRGDTVALMFNNQPEFHVADLAAVTLGATPFSIYATSSPEQIAYVVSDAGARVAVIDASFTKQFLAARDDIDGLEHIIVAGDAPEGTTPWEEIANAGGDFDAAASAAEVEPDDILTLIYTSGTTGPPKGVELSHANLIAAVQAFGQLIEFPDGGRVISWLPNAHIAERAAHHYIPMSYGLTVTCCEDPRKIGEVLPEVHPNWFFAVPRIWEKMKAGLEAKLGSIPGEQGEKAAQALEAAKQKVRLEQAGQEVPEQLAQAVAAADEQLFSNLRVALGLDQLAACNVGAAPTPVEVLEFFHAIGVPIAELWGMSETCGAGTVNPPEKIKLGTVGPPSPGTEVKLAEDGELLVRGGVVMVGYRNQLDKTAETIDPEGWLHTGDIAEIDEDGYVKIVDRKKELIISAAGKNMSPANIEATLKSAHPLIGQATVIGDARKYNTALIVLDADYAPSWAEKAGVSGDTSLEGLAENEQVREEVQKGVDAANERLSRVEQIKKFHIVKGDWAPGGDELTPTMKLKRKPIEKKYSEAIEGMYKE
jgi:long-subunit acyl-CoA synthetase (AMP-forming)